MTNHDELCEKDKENKELRTRVAELQGIVACENGKVNYYIDKSEELQTRLSTLLKASEGMEKALEQLVWRINAEGGHGFDVHGLADKSKQALADFRAVKEGK